ncbi:MAG: XkdF-like putative serine protease domain-containing protein [Halopenitus sp.]
MPPVSKAGGSDFRKDVEFVAKDDDEQVAAGIVMVPDKADLQNDFAREETIRSFAEQFATFYEAGEAGGGVMHAVFPSEWMDLERNEVLDESEEIGGQTVDAGAWVQEWAINHDELWALVQDGIIAGYSIGAVSVEWNGPFEQDEVDDVEVPEELGDDLIYELIDGIIREVSAVDIPAVPDAMILDTKAAGAAEKRLGDYLGDPDGFIEEALQRGHSEEAAERLWDVLNDAVDVDGADEPGTKNRITEAAKNLIDAVTRSNDDPEPAKTASAPDQDPDEQPDKDAPDGDTSDDGGTDAADTTDMSNDNGGDGTDDGGDADKSLAEENAEQIKELTETVETLTEALTGEEKTVEIEVDGETVEVPESKAKAALGVDGGAGEGGDGVDAEELKSLQKEVNEVAERLDRISKQSGVSDQLKGSRDGEGESNESALGGISEALS